MNNLLLFRLWRLDPLKVINFFPILTSSNAEQDEELDQQDTALEKHWESTSKVEAPN